MAEIKNKATLNNQPFNTSVGKMEGKVKSFSKSMSSMSKALGVSFGVAALTKMAQEAIATGDALDNMALQTGLSVEGVQALAVAAQEAGISFDTLRPTINQLRRAQENAINGSSEMTKAFDVLGISSTRLAGMSTEDTLEAVAKAMHDGGGAADIMAASTRVLGAESTRLRGILNDIGANGLGQLTQQYKELGLVIDESLIRQLDNAELEISRAKKQLSNFFAIQTGQAIRFGRVMKETFNQMSDGEKLLGILSPAAMVGQAFRGGAVDKALDKIGLDDAKARKAREEGERKRQEAIKNSAEESAKEELEKLNTRRRLRSLDVETRNQELKGQIKSLELEKQKESSYVRRLEIAREIEQLESQIRDVKIDAAEIDAAEIDKQEKQFNPFRNIGANALGTNSVKIGGGVDPRSREGQKQAARTFEIYGRRQIQQSERMIELMDQTNQALKGGSRL